MLRSRSHERGFTFSFSHLIASHRNESTTHWTRELRIGIAERRIAPGVLLLNAVGLTRRARSVEDWFESAGRVDKGT